jgi:Raf kinase inhibitor-like YbhB/YbcL family protein
MELTSPAFADNAPIPDAYTCRGAGISPPLNIGGNHDGAQSFALVVHDPEAPAGDFIHWIVWNISATTTVIKENTVPTGAIQGLNDFKKIGYGAPCPPSGTHHYVFELYALNRQLSLEPGAHAYALLAQLKEHTVMKAQLTGTVKA